MLDLSHRSGGTIIARAITVVLGQCGVAYVVGPRRTLTVTKVALMFGGAHSAM